MSNNASKVGHISFTVSGYGYPTVILHGFTGSALAMRPLTSLLEPKRRLVAIDLIGHGASDSPPNPDLYELHHAVADVLSVLDAAVKEPPDVIGYSMGARVALAALLDAPDRLRTAHLIGVRPGIADQAERAVRKDADDHLADEIEANGIEWFARRWVQEPIIAASLSDEDARQSAYEARLANDPRGLANSLRAMGAGAQPSLWHRLDEVTTPTTLIAGAHDQAFVAIHEEMKTSMSCASTAVIAGAGHAAHLDQPQAVAALIGGGTS